MKLRRGSGGSQDHTAPGTRSGEALSMLQLQPLYREQGPGV